MSVLQPEAMTLLKTLASTNIAKLEAITATLVLQKVTLHAYLSITKMDINAATVAKSMFHPTAVRQLLSHTARTAHNNWFQGTAPAAQPLNQSVRCLSPYQGFKSSRPICIESFFAWWMRAKFNICREFLDSVLLAINIVFFSLQCYASISSREHLNIGLGSVFLASRACRYCPTMQRQYQLDRLLSRRRVQTCLWFWFRSTVGFLQALDHMAVGSQLTARGVASSSVPQLASELQGHLTKNSRGRRWRAAPEFGVRCLSPYQGFKSSRPICIESFFAWWMRAKFNICREFLDSVLLAINIVFFSLQCYASISSREHLNIGLGSVFLASRACRYCPTMQRQYQLDRLLSRRRVQTCLWFWFRSTVGFLQALDHMAVGSQLTARGVASSSVPQLASELQGHLNRVRAGFSPALPTPPGMRIRTGRFTGDSET